MGRFFGAVFWGDMVSKMPKAKENKNNLFFESRGCGEKMILLLQETSNLVFVSYVYFLEHSRKNRYEIGLGLSLLFLFVCSKLFWNEPVQYSWIHRLDGVVAKLVIGCFIMYTLICKKMNAYSLCLYWGLLIGIALSFYMSNYYSNINWCCSLHIFYHGLLHVCCFGASLYAFV